MNLLCSHCNQINDINVDSFNENFSFLCSNCFNVIAVTYDTTFNISKLHINQHRHVLFQNGDLVMIDNREHPWHNEIAIIRDFKPGFYRLELLGSMTWIPEHWINKLDETI